MRVHFSVEFHSGGLLRKRFEVPANACRGLEYVPDFEHMCQNMPARYWPAIQRAGWWRDANFPHFPARLDMTDKRGKALGTLFATQLG